MKWKICLFAGALIANLAVVALAVAYSYAQRERDELRAQREDICRRLESDAFSAAVLRRTQPELHARIAILHLDQGLQRLCFGRANVVNTSDADYCWILKGDEHCYLDVARQFYELYRRRHE
jgi:hypothetical protein